ncbi:MAG: porin [Rhodobacteraceae bacterium]|nr:MAG: porin [Paracoccaceae bacterium]
MKKLLLASTALVMSAGYAAADVSLSGDARMGIVYDSGAANELSFTSRARVTFTLSGETDTGLAFGASFRADNAGGAATDRASSTGTAPETVPFSGQGMTAGSVFISGDFGELRMGDVSGAAEFIVGDLAGVGLTGLGDLNEMTYLVNSPAQWRPTARYSYTLDGLKLALSIENPQTDATGDRFAASIAASYTFDGFTGGLGYESVLDGADHIIGFVGADIEGITAKAIYGRISGGDTQYGLSVSGSFDEVTVTAFGRRDFDSDTHYGIGASYNLGGGAALRGGVVRNGTSSDTVADFGLAFTF